MHSDPIRQYTALFSYEPDEINRIIIGRKYLACQLRNGNLGVCATLLHEFPAGYTHKKQPDLKDHCDRILVNAWLNARINNQKLPFEQGDIFEHFEFTTKDPVVMIGYFGPLISKFQHAGIPLSVFDYYPRPDTLPLEKQKEYLSQSTTVILTSTTISNGSFVDIIHHTSPDARILLLGPSGILDQGMFQYPGISGIYGMIFDQNQDKVMESIARGAGTPEFGKFGTKVFMRS